MPCRFVGRCFLSRDTESVKINLKHLEGRQRGNDVVTSLHLQLQKAQHAILYLDGHWLTRLNSAAAALACALRSPVRLYGTTPDSNCYVQLAEAPSPAPLAGAASTYHATPEDGARATDAAGSPAHGCDASRTAAFATPRPRCGTSLCLGHHADRPPDLKAPWEAGGGQPQPQPQAHTVGAVVPAATLHSLALPRPCAAPPQLQHGTAPAQEGRMQPGAQPQPPPHPALRPQLAPPGCMPLAGPGPDDRPGGRTPQPQPVVIIIAHAGTCVGAIVADSGAAVPGLATAAAAANAAASPGTAASAPSAAPPAADVIAVQQLAAAVGQVCWGSHAASIAAVCRGMEGLAAAPSVAAAVAAAAAALEAAALLACRLQPLGCHLALLHGGGGAAALFEEGVRQPGRGPRTSTSTGVAGTGSGMAAGTRSGVAGGGGGLVRRSCSGLEERSGSRHRQLQQQQAASALPAPTEASPPGCGPDQLQGSAPGATGDKAAGMAAETQPAAGFGAAGPPTTAHVFTLRQTLLDQALAAARQAAAAQAQAAAQRAAGPGAAQPAPWDADGPCAAAADSGLAGGPAAAAADAVAAHWRRLLLTAGRPAARGPGPHAHPAAVQPVQAAAAAAPAASPKAADGGAPAPDLGRAASSRVCLGARAAAHGDHAHVHGGPGGWARGPGGGGGGGLAVARTLVTDVCRHVSDANAAKDLLIFSGKGGAGRPASLALLACAGAGGGGAAGVEAAGAGGSARPQGVALQQAQALSRPPSGGSGRSAPPGEAAPYSSSVPSAAALYVSFAAPLPAPFLAHMAAELEPALRVLVPALQHALRGPALSGEWGLLHDGVLGQLLQPPGRPPPPPREAAHPATPSGVGGGRVSRAATAGPGALSSTLTDAASAVAAQRWPSDTSMSTRTGSCSDRAASGPRRATMGAAVLGTGPSGCLPVPSGPIPSSSGPHPSPIPSFTPAFVPGGAAGGESCLSFSIHHVRGNTLRPLLSSVQSSLAALCGGGGGGGGGAQGPGGPAGYPAGMGPGVAAAAAAQRQEQQLASGDDRAILAAAAAAAAAGLTDGSGDSSGSATASAASCPLAEVHCRLGQGSFGCVYGGTWQGVGVAIKIFPSAAAGAGARGPHPPSRPLAPPHPAPASAAAHSPPHRAADRAASPAPPPGPRATVLGVAGEGGGAHGAAAAAAPSRGIPRVSSHPSLAPPARCLQLQPQPASQAHAAAEAAAAAAAEAVDAARWRSVRDAFELAALRVLSHPNIVQVFATFPDVLQQPASAGQAGELPALLLPRPHDGRGAGGGRPRLALALQLAAARGSRGAAAAADEAAGAVAAAAAAARGSRGSLASVEEDAELGGGDGDGDDQLLLTLLQPGRSSGDCRRAAGPPSQPVTAIVMEACDCGSLRGLLRAGGLRRLMMAAEHAAARAAMSSAAMSSAATHTQPYFATSAGAPYGSSTPTPHLSSAAAAAAAATPVHSPYGQHPHPHSHPQPQPQPQPRAHSHHHSSLLLGSDASPLQAGAASSAQLPGLQLPPAARPCGVAAYAPGSAIAPATWGTASWGSAFLLDGSRASPGASGRLLQHAQLLHHHHHQHPQQAQQAQQAGSGQQGLSAARLSGQAAPASPAPAARGWVEARASHAGDAGAGSGMPHEHPPPAHGAGRPPAAAAAAAAAGNSSSTPLLRLPLHHDLSSPFASAAAPASATGTGTRNSRHLQGVPYVVMAPPGYGIPSPGPAMPYLSFGGSGVHAAACAPAASPLLLTAQQLAGPLAPVPATPKTFEALRQFLSSTQSTQPAASGGGAGGGGGVICHGGGGEAGRLDWAPPLLVALELASALQHLHSMRLVHCDLKPSNVLLKSSASDPRGWVCKLSDFGCVRLLHAEELPATPTPTAMQAHAHAPPAAHIPAASPGGTGPAAGWGPAGTPAAAGAAARASWDGGSGGGAAPPGGGAAGRGGGGDALVFDGANFVGSVQYMAPELLRREPRCTAAVDIYSLGVLLWELVADGAAPYTPPGPKRRLPASLVEGICAGLRPAWPDWVPGWYRRLVEGCWAAHPAERPTAAALVAAVRQLLEGLAAAGGQGAGQGLGAGWYAAGPHPPLGAAPSP